jgi:UDPglucose 6-dehydrogenase
MSKPVCFAEIGHRVTCVDNDEAKGEDAAEGGVPIFERYLPELLAKHRGRGVEFTTDLARRVEQSEAVFIAVGTPQGDTGAADLSYVEAVVSEIARSINAYKVIVEKSTVPVYTNEWIRRVLHRHGVKPQNFDVVSNPEFLREGTAIMDFLHPDRIVVGANSERAAEVLRRIYEPLTGGSYYDQAPMPGPGSAALRCQLLVTSAQSAEIIKHASNAFLASKISFINAVANLAETVDADIEDIAAGMGMDSRIGPKFLRAGLGYGGSCFPKDVAAFHWVAQQQGVDFQLLQEVSRSTRLRRKSSSTRCARRCGLCAASGWRRWVSPSKGVPTTSAILRRSTSSKSLSKPAPLSQLTIRRPWSERGKYCRRRRG